jgi:hypothetical protein
MTRRRVAGIAAIALGLVLLGVAHDVRAWQRTLASGDARLAKQASRARWTPETWLPFDPAGSILGVSEPVRELEAGRAFEIWRRAPLGFDNGARRKRLHAQAELALSDVVAGGSPQAASRAGTLLGIVLASDDEQSASAAFDAAIRADPSNDDAKYDLELVVRRARAHGTREGLGNGSGVRGKTAEGAGAGTAGAGY